MHRAPGLAKLFALSVLLAACASAPPPTPSVTAIPSAELRRDLSQLPASGYLVTGQPDAATLQAIAAAGYTAVVDLRTPGESRGFDEAATARELGLSYHSVPVAGPDDVSWDRAAELDGILAGLTGPVLLHCASGNRVGALFALRAKAAGASTDEALAAGRAAGLRSLEPVVRSRLGER